jgi:formamidopyrimidine-DNA glycosylase
MSEPMDESLERENYEISNSLNNCPNCGAQMTEQTAGKRSQIICPVCQTVTHEFYEQ